MMNKHLSSRRSKKGSYFISDNDEAYHKPGTTVAHSKILLRHRRHSLRLRRPISNQAPALSLLDGALFFCLCNKRVPFFTFTFFSFPSALLSHPPLLSTRSIVIGRSDSSSSLALPLPPDFSFSQPYSFLLPLILSTPSSFLCRTVLRHK
jgi:hypothetical protein